MKEQFKQFKPPFDHYWIGCQGTIKVKRGRKSRVLRHFTNPHGYQRVTFFRGQGHKTKRHYYVHVLVATVWVDNDNVFLNDQVHHANWLRDDNRKDNLIWVDYETNQKLKR